MKTAFYTVVSQGDVSYVASQKAENGQLAMCIVRLREFGGGKYDNEYVCILFGNLTQHKFQKMIWWWLRCAFKFTRWAKSAIRKSLLMTLSK